MASSQTMVSRLEESVCGKSDDSTLASIYNRLLPATIRWLERVSDSKPKYRALTRLGASSSLKRLVLCLYVVSVRATEIRLSHSPHPMARELPLHQRQAPRCERNARAPARPVCSPSARQVRREPRSVRRVHLGVRVQSACGACVSASCRLSIVASWCVFSLSHYERPTADVPKHRRAAEDTSSARDPVPRAPPGRAPSSRGHRVYGAT